MTSFDSSPRVGKGEERSSGGEVSPSLEPKTSSQTEPLPVFDMMFGSERGNLNRPGGMRTGTVSARVATELSLTKRPSLHHIERGSDVLEMRPASTEGKG